MDADNDGKLDLYVNRKAIYKNLGGGNFTQTGTGLQNQSGNLSNTWADYNNDGFIDCWVTSTGASNSFLYKNNGDGSFTKITSGVIGDSAYNTGWGCAWGDYDNDGYTDLIIAAANNFGVVNHPNRLYHNSGDGSFTRVDMPGLTDTLAPFTVPTWNDYDQDGDMDLFLASGPANGTPAQDLCYKNMKKETGIDTLVRMTSELFAQHTQDGQCYNFIDYDNDGDLDIIVSHVDLIATPVLLRNDGGNRNNWLGLTLKSHAGLAPAISAKVTVFSGSLKQVLINQWITGYLSSNDPRLHIGLGKHKTIDSLEIAWSDGQTETYRNIRANRYITIMQGEGVVE